MNTWKTLLLSSFVLVVSGCGLIDCTRGSGVKKTESRRVPVFTQVEVRGSSDVDIRQGKNLSVKVTSDDNLLPLIETKVEDGTLIIDTTESFSTALGTQVAIEMPSLTGVAIKGSGNVKAKGVEAQEFAASIAGSGDIDVSGTGGTVKATVEGSGDIDLSHFNCREAEASIAGSGDISLTVSDDLHVSVAGSGNVNYAGDPKVETSINGSGEVRKR